MDAIVGKITVNDKTYDVRLSGYHRFTALVGPTVCTGSTWEELEGVIRREQSRSKVTLSIAVVLSDPLGYERATLRGINVRTGQALLTREDGEKETMDHPDILCLGEEITDAELADLNNLLALVDAAKEKLRERKFALGIGAKHYSARGLVQKAEEQVIGKIGGKA
jgi:hypothetical protein